MKQPNLRLFHRITIEDTKLSIETNFQYILAGLSKELMNYLKKHTNDISQECSIEEIEHGCVQIKEKIHSDHICGKKIIKDSEKNILLSIEYLFEAIKIYKYAQSKELLAMHVFNLTPPPKI